MIEWKHCSFQLNKLGLATESAFDESYNLGVKIEPSRTEMLKICNRRVKVKK